MKKIFDFFFKRKIININIHSLGTFNVTTNKVKEEIVDAFIKSD